MKKLTRKIIVDSLIGLPMISNAQWNNALLPDIRTQTTTRSVGVGTFTNFNRPKANLHVNQLLMPNSPFFAVGSLFRTDGNQNVVNQWQLFTGANANSTTQKFSLFVPANSVNATLESTQPGSSIIINTNGTNERARFNQNGNLEVRTPPNEAYPPGCCLRYKRKNCYTWSYSCYSH